MSATSRALPSDGAPLARRPMPGETGRDVRRASRAGFSGVTVGRAPGYVQANLFVLPESHAADFEAFCTGNPAACPLLGRSVAGSPVIEGLGADIDLRVDLPAYLVHVGGRSHGVADIADLWRPDFVAFALGCWLGAEEALARAGIRLRHRELGLQGGLYRTRLPTRPAGPFGGPLVASMRPFQAGDVERVAAITARLPRSHGAPFHSGDPAAIGIADLACADWGDPVLPEAGEVPVFWPCGLTALAALQASGLPFFISHAPGAMLVTDLKEALAP